jgi:uncharacterized repeat protein (TIGR01451 family)
MKLFKLSIKALVISFVLFAIFFLMPGTSFALEPWTQSNVTGFGIAANHNGLFTVYNGKLFDVVNNMADSPFQVWQYDGSNWTKSATDGFGDSHNQASYAQIIYNNKFYVAVDNTTTGVQVWQYDGSSWTQVNIAGFGNKNYVQTNSFVINDNKLYLDLEYSSYGSGAEVWQYDGSSWTQVNTAGFGVNDSDILSFISYNNNLYAFDDSNQIFKYGSGTSWTKINVAGFGDPNNMISASKVYDNNLYVGTYNNNTGAEMWRYNGISWIQVGTDGFSDPNTISITSLIIYGDKLYLGMENDTVGGAVFSFNGTTLTKVSQNGFGNANNHAVSANIVYDNNLYTVTQNVSTNAVIIWGYNGLSWTETADSAFGDLSNGWLNNFVIYNHRIYAGTEDLTNGTAVFKAYDLAQLNLSLVGLDAANPGQNLSYQLTLKNNGPDDAGDIILDITLPTGATFTSCSGSGWTCVNDSLEASLNKLASGDFSALTINFTAPQTSGNYSFNASANFGGIINGDNQNIASKFTVANSPIISVLPQTGANLLTPQLELIFDPFYI